VRRGGSLLDDDSRSRKHGGLAVSGHLWLGLFQTVHHVRPAARVQPPRRAAMAVLDTTRRALPLAGDQLLVSRGSPHGCQAECNKGDKSGIRYTGAERHPDPRVEVEPLGDLTVAANASTGPPRHKRGGPSPWYTEPYEGAT